MSGNRIYVEGGGDSKELQTRCREGFRKLLEKSGFTGKVPRIVACGGRHDSYETFRTAHENSPLDYIALIADSEDPVADTEQPWAHLKARDGSSRPKGATDEQVFLMTTCMETWIVADRASLKKYYDSKFREKALPPDSGLEQRNRHDVQDKLATASKDCSCAYQKGKRSFEVLPAIDPAVLKTNLPAFARMIRILAMKLK